MEENQVEESVEEQKEEEESFLDTLKPGYEPPKEFHSLESFMWGTAGVPSGEEEVVEEAEVEQDDNVEEQQEEVNEDEKEQEKEEEPNEVARAEAEALFDDEEPVRAACLVWKKRSGLGKYYKSTWQRRWLVLRGTTILYYRLADTVEEGEDEDDDEEAATTEEQPPTDWSNRMPRGVMDLVEEEATVEVVYHKTKSTTTPTPYELHIIADDGDHTWKFCFEKQEQQMEWLTMLHDVLVEAGHIRDAEERHFEHDFEAGDHIFRWEMVIFPPVIYPIQIHGIVLEAGRNCVIVADFGLTGYGKKTEGETFTTHDPELRQSELHDSTLRAWNKLRPTEEQRLNVITLIDPKEIRKWKKASYAKSSKKKKSKLGKMSSFFSTQSDHGSASAYYQQRKRASSHDHVSTNNGSVSLKQERQSRVKDDGSASPKRPSPRLKSSRSQGDEQSQDVASREQSSSNSTEVAATTAFKVENNDKMDGEPAVPSTPLAQNSEATTRRADSSVSETPEWLKDDIGSLHTPDWIWKDRDSMQSQVPEWFGGDDEEETQIRKNQNELPKSDPTKIVLARAHFLLEFGDEILPPYHVFYSNSECIAVWCKTGRWSTLQTAVFLTTTSGCSAKSVTMATLGVAAAHAVLAPVVAVGGLLWVSAPLVMLKKSKAKWDEATMQLTELFWSHCDPEVFVAAIETWSDLH